MKKWNQLMLIVATATVGASLSAQTCKPSAIAGLTDNAALLSSPRYREEHPELLRCPPPREMTAALEAQRLAALTENTALANNPRFLEEHPELLRAGFATEQPQSVSEADRLRKLTENKALAASPRFREVHPELLHAQPVFEIAPVK
jgi:hypothetical protein